MLVKNVSVFAVLFLMSACTGYKSAKVTSEEQQDTTDYYEYEYESNSVTSSESDSTLFAIQPTTNYESVFRTIDSIAINNPYWYHLRPDPSYPKEDEVRGHIEGLSYFTTDADFWHKACSWAIRQYMNEQDITLPQTPIEASLRYESLLDTFLIALKGKDDLVNIAYFRNAEFLLTKYKSFFYRDILRSKINNSELTDLLNQEFELWNTWFEAKKKEIDIVAGLEVVTYFGWQESMDRLAFLKRMQENFIYCARNLYFSLNDNNYLPARYYKEDIISDKRLNEEFDYSIENINKIRFEAQGDEKRVITDNECADVFRFQKHVWNKWMSLRHKISNQLKGHTKTIYQYNTNLLKRAQMVAFKNEEVYIGVCSQSVIDALYHMDSSDNQLLARKRIHDILDYD